MNMKLCVIGAAAAMALVFSGMSAEACNPLLNKGKAATPCKEIVQARWQGRQPSSLTNDLQQLGQGIIQLNLRAHLPQLRRKISDRRFQFFNFLVLF